MLSTKQTTTVRANEQALLAYVLRNPGAFSRLHDIVKPTDFWWRPFGWAWEAMAYLNEKGLTIDNITLADALNREGHLQEFCVASGSNHRGLAAITQIKDIPTSEGGEAYASNVQDYSAKRHITELLSKAATWAQNGRPAADIVADLSASMSEITLYNGKTSQHTYSMDEATGNAVNAALKASKGDREVTFGLVDVDLLLKPLRTELITVAARPGKGKSSFLATCAIGAARKGLGVKYFVLEMGHVPTIQRMLAQISGIDAYRVMHGKLTTEEWAKLKEARDELASLPITICDLPAIKPSQMKVEARKSPFDLLILDYIQLASPDIKSERRDIDIGQVTGGLVAIAGEMDVVCLAAAQMSRNVEARSDKMPTLSDLRESGSIENDSSTVIFLHESDGNGVDVICDKHRNGAIGKCTVYFDRVTTAFKNGITTYRDFTK